MSGLYVVSELFIYPIKSLAGIPVHSANALEMGFEHDRRWMLIDENNQFITQRDHFHLSQFHPNIIGDEIEIYHATETHSFSINENLAEPILSKVWDDNSTVFEVSKMTSDWFSNQLGFRCKLVKIIDSGDRKHSSSKLNKTLNVSLADGYPYLLIGTKSLALLNEKLKDKITIERFRPNIVVTTQTPHEEDYFDKFQIGTVKFQNVRPSSRCIMVNNNPKTGIVAKEPLLTLSKYRNVENAVFFGTNIMCNNFGIISIGDTLEF